MPVSKNKIPDPSPTPEYAALKRMVLDLGYVRPGSLVKRYMPCGRAGCRCMADPPQLHGPYHQWSHKVKGKTVTRRLSPDQARICRRWVIDHRRFRRLLRRMEVMSLRETDRILASLSGP
jgi:hypothetical protein